MTSYETIVITKPNMEDKFVIATIKAIISDNEGKIDNIEEWGQRKIAYPIKHFTEGVYTMINFSTKQGGFGQELCNKLQEYYKNDEQIIKYIIVRKDN